MKKLILLSLILFPMLVMSQAVSYQLATADTLSNADTGIYVMPKAVTGLYQYSIQCTSTKVSGSNGLVTAYLQGSMDGTNWADLDTVIAASNASATGVDYDITGTLYSWYRVYTLQSGTTKNIQNYVFWINPVYGTPGTRIFSVHDKVLTDAQTVYYTNAGLNTASRPYTGSYEYRIYVANDSISGSGTTIFTLAGSNDNTNWTTISTTTYTKDGSTSYTGTGTYFKYYKLTAAHSGTGVDNIDIYGVLQRKKY